MTTTNVVIAEFDPNTARQIQQVARALHVEPRIVIQPGEFETAVLDFKPAVVCLDIRFQYLLSYVTPLELLARIAPSTRIIAVASQRGEAQRIVDQGHALGLDMCGIVLKPVDAQAASEVLEPVVSALRGSKNECQVDERMTCAD